MARYEYIGPGPHEDADLGLIRPGDVRDFDEEPAFGPWRGIVEETEEDADETVEEPVEPPKATAPPPTPPVIGLSAPATPAKEF